MGLLSRAVFREAHATAASDAAALSEFTCDIAFISDESTPAEDLIIAECNRAESPATRRVIQNIFDQLRARRDAGEPIAHPAAIHKLIAESSRDERVNLSLGQCDEFRRFFDRINQILFEHQTLGWLADCEHKVHIYGTGWEANRMAAKFARGSIESAAMLSAIHQASRIHLAANPYGAVRPQVIDGISAGGFYLMRFSPGDLIERFYPALQDFCNAHEVHTNDELRARMTPELSRLIDFASHTLGLDLLADWQGFVPHLRSAVFQRTHSAAALWPQYADVTFNSGDELLGLVAKYLYDVPKRKRIADEMRRDLLNHLRRVEVTVNRDVIAALGAPHRTEAAA